MFNRGHEWNFNAWLTAVGNLTRTRDLPQPELRACSHPKGCGKTLPLSEFWSNGTLADGSPTYRTICRHCANARLRKKNARA